MENKPEATEPPEQTTQETTQPEETVTEPEFDINYWVEYAKNYATSKGLVLSSAAVDCWDNPIGAGAYCVYLERDIQSRLNRYANDEDITDVWIWTEPTGNPKTGDNSNIALWATLAVLSLAGIGITGFVTFKKRKKEDE